MFSSGDVAQTTGLCISDLCLYSGHFEEGARNLTQLDEMMGVYPGGSPLGAKIAVIETIITDI